jgi:uncharacterized protein YrrD
MTIRAGEMIGIPVSSADQKTVFGDIDSVIYDNEHREIVAFTISEETGIPRQVIRYADIDQVSTDYILLKEGSTPKRARDVFPRNIPESVSSFGAENIRENTSGIVKDIIFDPETGTAQAFVMQRLDYPSGYEQVQLKDAQPRVEGLVVLSDRFRSRPFNR